MITTLCVTTDRVLLYDADFKSTECLSGLQISRTCDLISSRTVPYSSCIQDNVYPVSDEVSVFYIAVYDRCVFKPGYAL